MMTSFYIAAYWYLINDKWFTSPLEKLISACPEANYETRYSGIMMIRHFAFISIIYLVVNRPSWYCFSLSQKCRKPIAFWESHTSFPHTAYFLSSDNTHAWLFVGYFKKQVWKRVIFILSFRCNILPRVYYLPFEIELMMRIVIIV